MNRARIRIAVLGLPLVALGIGLGCLGQAERAYFDDLIDGSIDGTTGPVDASMPDAPDAPVATDASEAGDVGIDVLDAGFDAPIDCGPKNTVTNCGSCGAACDTDSGTPTACTSGACQYTCNAGYGDCQQAAPNTNGCETPLNTTANCSACGIACDTANSLDASCNGTTCKYRGCKAGWSDCKSAPPNADGCECNAPGCCGDSGTVCEPLHNNGIGNPFYDCTPLGTYSANLALQACIAYTDAATQCTSYPCKNTTMGPIICSDGVPGGKPCMCWSFGGTNIGLVDNGGPYPDGAAPICFCPAASQGDTNWQ